MILPPKRQLFKKLPLIKQKIGCRKRESQWIFAFKKRENVFYDVLHNHLTGKRKRKRKNTPHASHLLHCQEDLESSDSLKEPRLEQIKKYQLNHEIKNQSNNWVQRENAIYQKINIIECKIVKYSRKIMWQLYEHKKKWLYTNKICHLSSRFEQDSGLCIIGPFPTQGSRSKIQLEK